MPSYDAIIIGGGPAGLLLARNLSKKHSVLVLEKNRIGDTKRSWLTYEDRWHHEGFPSSMITNSFSEWALGAEDPSPEHIVIKDRFICFDEHAFLRYISEEARRSGCAIQEGTPFQGFSRKGKDVLINGTYTTRLVIDCSGSQSKLIKQFKLVEVPLSINCHGYVAEFRKLANENYYSAYDDRQAVCSNFGITKVAENKAFITYVTFTDLPIRDSPRRMAEALKRFSIGKHTILEDKTDSYQAGILKKRALDNFFFFGDAGFYSPPYTGMGFNEIVRQYTSVAKHLSGRIRSQAFDEGSLLPTETMAQDIDNLFFRLVGLITSGAPYESLRRMVEIGKTLPNAALQRMFRNELSDGEVVTVIKNALAEHDLMPLVRNMRRQHVTPLLKTLVRLDEKLVLEELHDLIFQHHKIRI
ncbi:MAG: NAD(P)-binding protein [Nanoarchaeota archaeon]